MREYEFNKMDEARARQDGEHNLQQAEVKLSCDIDRINRLRKNLGIKPIVVNFEWESTDEGVSDD